MVLVWIIILAALPTIAVSMRLLEQAHPLTPYLTPRFLNRTDHTKAELRRSGSAWILWSGWLILLPIAAVSQVPFGRLEPYPILLAILLFIIPVTAVVLQIAGWMLLLQGVFGKSERTTPLVDSMFAADPEQLPVYIWRMWRYARLSVTMFVLAVLVPVSEAYLQVPPTGIVVLVNVSFLITFIVTLWRTRAYVVKCCVVMSQSGPKAFYSMVGGASSILFVWYNAYRTRQEYLNGNFGLARRSTNVNSSAQRPQ